MQDSEGSRTSQESRDILWRILAIRGEMALVLSEQLLEVMPFHFKEGSPSWEYCSLRTWLNTDFLLSAFTPEERETIVRTPLEENVRDWIFLLSMEELEKYTSREDVLCKNGIYRKADAIAAPVPWKTVKNEKVSATTGGCALSARTIRASEASPSISTAAAITASPPFTSSAG